MTAFVVVGLLSWSRGASYNRDMASGALFRRIAIVGFLAVPAVAFGHSGASKPAPNVVGLEAGAGINALTKAGVQGIARFTINCPTLHGSRNTLRIAWQKPTSGAAVHSGQTAVIVVARKAEPKAHRKEPLPQGLSRAPLCGVVSH